MKNNYRLTKLACYTINLTMSVVGNISPILFLTFRELYDVSFSLLGLLVLVNFLTQLSVDLVFSFFSHKFDIEKVVRLNPVIAFVGFIVYALAPLIFKDNVFLGILIGTVIFSLSGGLSEVLISPIIAAIPSENPDREMSKLHSIYAFGVVFVVIFSTVFLLVFKNTSWQWLAVIYSLIPLLSSVLFAFSDIPKMQNEKSDSEGKYLFKDPRLYLCVLAIFLGGAAECTMAQWASGYLESALGLPKIFGDIFGVAMFAAMLGLGRGLYAKFGKSAPRVLLLSAVGATACYIVAALSPYPVIGLITCALTGLCTAMLWPGNLIVASDRFPSGGVVIFALMAAGGDLGASISPQLVGLITDAAIESASVISFAESIGLSPEQVGMRLGMLVGAIFPLIAVFVNYCFLRKEKSDK